jgi:hypothetical protein
MRIAVFDHRVLRTNPVGSCHRALLQVLCHGHDFTVFAVQFDNPCPERINWVRVRVVPRRCCSWPTTWWHRSATCSSSDSEGIPTTWSKWSRATWRWATCRTSTSATARSCGRRRPGAGPCETGFAGSTIASTPWPSPGCSAASAASSFPARAGPRAARGVPDDRRQGGRHPQRGRPRQDAAVGGLRPPVRPPGGTLQPRPRRRRHRLRRARALRAQGFSPLLEALRQLDDARFKLVVIGGQPNLVKAHRATAAKLAVAGQVAFVGHAGRRPAVPLGRRHLRAPVRLRSRPAGCPGGGAAGLPLLATGLDGLRDLLADGETGYVVDRTGVSMAAGLRRFGSLPESRRQQMATVARAAAQRYGLDAFVAGWAKLYAGLEA